MDLTQLIIPLLPVRVKKGTLGAMEDELKKLREAIDTIDEELLAVLAQRMQKSREIGEYKLAHNIPALDSERWNELLSNRIIEAEKKHLSAEFIAKLYELIHEESLAAQKKI